MTSDRHPGSGLCGHHGDRSLRLHGSHRMLGRALSLLVRAMLAALCAWSLPLAQAQTAPESKRPAAAGDAATLKAAFLYNFALYTSWPPPPANAVTLCAIGRDELGAAFDALANKQIDGKPVQVRRIDSAAEARACHVLYVPESGAGNLPALTRGLASQPVLVVSDSGNLDTSMILIEAEGNRLVFSVNLSRVRNVGLDVSSKLLRLARVVR